jgi:DNA polymerase I-like protein with 3'-5' exonuclease and polymerase domains
MDKEDVPAPMGDGSKTWRFWGKKANHGLNYDLGFKSFALYYEIPERDAKFIVEKYHQAYPGVRHGFHSYIKSCLRKSRTITNLMGRRTLFLDQWGDNLFKEAFSCIPQGTTGDKINEHGLIEIYYNPHQYGPVELLLQVHDDIGFQIPLSTGWRHTAEMLNSIKQSLEKPLTTHHGLEFVIPADLSFGTSLNKATCAEIKHSKWPNDLDTLANTLKKSYEELANVQTEI